MSSETEPAPPAPQGTVIPWVFLGVVFVLSFAASWIGIEALVEELRQKGKPRHLAQANQLSATAWRLALGFAPLLTAWVAVLRPRVRTLLESLAPEKVALGAAAICVWSLLLTSQNFFTSAGFDIYRPAILGSAAFAAVLATRGGLTEGRLSGLALAVWLLLWIPFDLRWYKQIWLGGGEGAYQVFSLQVFLLGVLAFGVVGRLGDLGLRPPKWKDLPHTGIWLVGFGVIAIPIGLATGFLDFNNPQMGPGMAVLVAIGIAVTIALPEELFFRGVLDAGLQKYFKWPWVSLVISSFAFGLMHWNNEDELKYRLLYLVMATVAGVFYGLAFRKSKGLWAPVLVHTLVDLIWAIWLKR